MEDACFSKEYPLLKAINMAESHEKVALKYSHTTVPEHLNYFHWK